MANKDKEEKKKPTGNYPVGYALPPKAHNFPPGKCGNPKGRPKREPEMIGKTMYEMLTEPVTVMRGGKQVKLSPFEMRLTAVINKIISKADIKAIDYLLKQVKKYHLIPETRVVTKSSVITLPKVIGAPQEMAMMLAHRFGVDRHGWTPEEIELVRPDFEAVQRKDDEELKNRFRAELGGIHV